MLRCRKTPVTRGTSTVLAALCAAIGAFLALPVAASGHSTFLQAGPAAAPIGSAAAVIGGTRWPGRGTARITYFSSSENRWPVAQAVAAWNSSGARVRFVPVPRPRAQVVISDSTAARSDSYVAGFASIGYVYPGGGYVHLSRLAHPRRPHYSMAGVATHELGHVLGLDHEDGGCATMNSTLWSACAERPCRLLERDDIRGAIKLYGGRARMVRPGFCPKPPSQIRATGDPNAYGVSLEWRNPGGPFFDGVQVARGKDKCPGRPKPGTGFGRSSTDKPGAAARFVDRDYSSGERLLTGRYCYGFWAGSAAGPVSRRKTIWVDFKPVRPAAPRDLRAVVGPAGVVSVTWAQTPHPELEEVRGSAARGRCPAFPNDGDHPIDAAAGGTSSSVHLGTAGRYCFAIWARDSTGTWIGPATVWVDHKGTPPDASFYYGSAWSNTGTYFYDQSSDADYDEIVSRRWEFGDGTPVVEGNEPNPAHAYAAAGTYTVRLTITDATGLTGTLTQAVTVSDGGGGSPEEYPY